MDILTINNIFKKTRKKNKKISENLQIISPEIELLANPKPTLIFFHILKTKFIYIINTYYNKIP